MQVGGGGGGGGDFEKAWSGWGLRAWIFSSNGAKLSMREGEGGEGATFIA